jgi:hypothetical protein
MKWTARSSEIHGGNLREIDGFLALGLLTFAAISLFPAQLAVVDTIASDSNSVNF